MNKKAQAPYGWIGGIIALVVAIFIGSMLMQALSDIGCENEKNQISQLQDKVARQESEIISLKQLLEQCDAKIQQTEGSCDEKINNATSTCQNDLNFYIDIIKSYNVVIVIYSFILIFGVVLTINLFELGLKFSFGRKVDRLLEKYETAWRWFKFILWVITLVLIVSFFWTIWKIV